MTLEIKHTFVSAEADDPTAAANGEVLPSHWNALLTAEMATARVLGRTTAGAGAVEELTGSAVKTLAGLGNVDNTADASKPISTATQTALDLKAPIASPTFTGTVTLAADPASALQAATKQYVDGLLAGVGRRQRVRAATTANITISTALNSGDVLDGVTLANGDLVLVKDQTTGSQNGVYVVSASPARSTEFDAWDEFPGSMIGVGEGTANDNTLWFCTNNAGGTLGTTAITFTQFRVAGELLAANNLSDVANAATAFGNIKQAATATATGVVELATDAETQTGTDTARAITPANLSARTATTTRTGVVELATDAEAITGTDTTRAITPANLAAVLATIGGGTVDVSRKGFLNTTTITTGSAGQDNYYVDITVSAVADYTKTQVRFQGGGGSNATSAQLKAGATDAIELMARMTSNTNVRISTARTTAPGAFVGYWVIEENN